MVDAELKVSLDRLRESVDALRVAIESRSQAATGGSSDADLHGHIQTLSRLLADDLIGEDEYHERKDELLKRWSS